MSASWVIAKREFGAFFKSPIGYVIVGAFIVVTGSLFFSDFFLVGQTSMEGFFGNMPFLFLFFGPAIAMRLFAEEKASGTIELLFTMPVRDSEVVVGKFLSALGVVVVAMVFTFPIVFTIGKLGNLDMGPVWGGYLGFLLLSGTYLAIGMFASTLTRDQVVAYIVGFAICLGLYMLGARADEFGPKLGPVLRYMSPQYHFQKIARGVIELRNIVYYLSIIGVLLLLSIQVLESRKWR